MSYDIVNKDRMVHDRTQHNAQVYIFIYGRREGGEVGTENLEKLVGGASL